MTSPLQQKYPDATACPGCEWKEASEVCTLCGMDKKKLSNGDSTRIYERAAWLLFHPQVDQRRHEQLAGVPKDC